MSTPRPARRYRALGRRWAKRGKTLGQAGRALGCLVRWTLIYPAVCLVGLLVSGLLLQLLTRLI